MMPVQDFECQIARGQIGRYVGGEMLSPNTLRQLGLHVAECAGCRDHLEGRRQALQSMVTSGRSASDTAEPHYAGSMTSRLAEPKSGRAPAKGTSSPAAQALMEQIRRKAGDGLPLVDREPTLEIPAAVAKPKGNLSPLLGKPAMYSIALAAVLIGMTYISKNPTGLFGPKLGSHKEAPKADQAPTPTTTTPATVPAPVTAPVATTAITTPTTALTSTAPAVTPPAPTTDKAAGSAIAIGHEPLGHGPLPAEVKTTTPPATTPVTPAPKTNAATTPADAKTEQPDPATTAAETKKPAVTAPKPTPTKAVVKPKPAAHKLAAKKGAAHRRLRKRGGSHAKKRGTGVVKIYAPN